MGSCHLTCQIRTAKRKPQSLFVLWGASPYAYRAHGSSPEEAPDWLLFEIHLCPTLRALRFLPDIFSFLTESERISEYYYPAAGLSHLSGLIHQLVRSAFATRAARVAKQMLQIDANGRSSCVALNTRYYSCHSHC